MDVETRGIVKKDFDGMYNMKNCNEWGEEIKICSHFFLPSFSFYIFLAFEISSLVFFPVFFFFFLR